MAISKKTGIRYADLPAVERASFSGNPSAARFAEQVRSILETRFGKSGGKLDRAVTWGDLVENGLAILRDSKGRPIQVDPGEFLPPLPPVEDGIPPAPTGLTATGAFANIILEWDRPTFSYFGYAEIWRSEVDNLAQSVMVGQTTAWLYADALDTPGTYYYWTRFVSVGGKVGSYNGVAGTPGQISLNPDYVLEMLEGQITESQLYQSLVERIDLTDNIPQIISDIETEIQDRIDAVQIVTNELNAEIQDRIDAVQDLSNSIAQNSADIQTEETARVDADEALAQSIQTLSSSLGDNTAAIQNEITARTNADDALAQDIQTLFATTGENTAAIQSETTARTDADSALAQDIQTLFSDVGDNTSAIQSEATTRADADSALTSQITNVQSIANAKNRTYWQESEPTTDLVEGDLWFKSNDNNKPHRWSGTDWVETEDPRIDQNIAAIQSEATTRANADSALAQDIQTLFSDVGDNTAAIQQEVTARTNADSALAQDIQTLFSDVGDNLAAIQNEATVRSDADDALAQDISTLFTTTGDNASAIQNEVTARTNADSALAQDIQTLFSDVGDNTAAIQQEAITRADVDGGLLAQWTLKTDVNGRVAGFGFASTENDGVPESEFIIISDKFQIVPPTSTGDTPKVVFAQAEVDGVQTTVIRNAMIADAAISRAKIVDLAVDDAKVENISAVKITFGEMHGDRIEANTLNADRLTVNSLAARLAVITTAYVDTANIEDAAITTAKISNAAINSAKIDVAAVTTAKIDDLAVTEAKIGNLAVTAAKIADANITNAKIANLAVTAAKIADANITNAKIGTAAVDTLKIAGEAVTMPRGATLADYAPPNGSWANLVAIYVPAGASGTIISFGCTPYRITAQNISVQLRVLENGGVIWTGGASESGLATSIVRSYGSAATYTLQALVYYLNGSGGLRDSYITAIGCKR